QHAGQAERGPGHAGPVDGQSGAVREPGGDGLGDERADEGVPPQSEEVPYDPAQAVLMAGGAKYLAVNADDFGFTHDVNAGIVEARAKGILTSTTLMANGAAFDDAVRLASENPALDVGVHLVLVGGRSVLRPERALPPSVGRLAAELALGRIDVYAE